ncbi:hypothetical protein J2S43_007535 [Catenuloplanes nepalensis]|uniref:Uncharacterized protein n=1 Tax=Catenuloplanes nepalensis TaxID=587533 RepID=A0ABT9N676_9ACTN|nr:hypothetical protein [Catenuloplanes nepalensis]MDP9799023.1 hypothetical protein [Catenuloplanes nepalensis]
MGSLDTLSALLSDFLTDHRDGVIVGALAVSMLSLMLAGLIVRRLIKSDRADRALTIVSVIVGYGWSAEAMWEIATEVLHLPGLFVVLAFFVFEAMLGTSMLRAEKHQRQHGHPGRHGRSAWTIAIVMGVIAASAGGSLVEVVLRFALPLLVTKQWWDGLPAAEDGKAPDATTWRWTPRRLLLAVGAIEPGARDTETVDRERRIRQMTDLEHRRQHGWSKAAGRRAAKLDRLTLGADDDMITEVRRRLARTGWYGRPGEPAELLSARAAAAQARTEADAAREAEAAAVAWAESAAQLAEAESARRVQAVAEADAMRTEADAQSAARAKAEVLATQYADAARRAGRDREAAEARAAAQVREARDRIAGYEHSAQRTAEDAQRAGSQARDAIDRLAEAQRLAQDAATARFAAEEVARQAKAEADTLRWQLAQAQHQAATVEADKTPAKDRPAGRSLAAVPSGAVPLPPGVSVPDIDGVAVATARRIVAAFYASPDAARTEIARAAGTSDRTVRRVLSALPNNGRPALAETA